MLLLIHVDGHGDFETLRVNSDMISVSQGWEIGSPGTTGDAEDLFRYFNPKVPTGVDSAKCLDLILTFNIKYLKINM